MARLKISDADKRIIREYALHNLYFFEKFILDNKDMVPHVHGKLCRFLQAEHIRKKQVTLPRGFLKTTTATIGRSLWLACRNPNIRILIASSVIDNARKMVGAIQRHVESNPRIRMFFPEIVPDNFNKVQWSGTAACIRRPKDFPEATFEAIGAGGSAISRHYDRIIEDDLIYPKQDDMSGSELMPNRDDIEKAIGWHKLAPSLLIDPGRGHMDNVGTRWAPYDLIGYIRKREPGWRHFEIKALNREGQPTWPERFSFETLKDLEEMQGPYLYSTQYLCKPIDPSARVFKREWLRFYSELPRGLRYFTTVDLAQWDHAKSTKNSQKCFNVILTVGIDAARHLWVARYDRGKFTPTQVVQLCAQHHRAFNTDKIGIEVVYYQKAILEEFKRFYEATGISLPVHGYNRDTKTTKEARIRGLQPLAANGCLHVRDDMKELLEEYEDYPMSRTRDILDALSDQLWIAKPPEVPREENVENLFDIEEIVERIKSKRRDSSYAVSSGLQDSSSFFSFDRS